ncbi:MAG TPA: hypothetical protein PLZ84_05095, partial [Clostridia bacterium]|nr:hypothetical protein [Clostridia bacterium]
MNAPIKGDMSILFPLLLIMGMNARGGPGKTTVQSAGKEQVTAETVNKEAEMDYYNEDLDIENNQDENYEPKENLAVRTNMGNPYTILSEIAP